MMATGNRADSTNAGLVGTRPAGTSPVDVGPATRVQPAWGRSVRGR